MKRKPTRLDGTQGAFFRFIDAYQRLIHRHVGEGIQLEYGSRYYMAMVHRHLEAVLAELPAGARILDIGCGRGHFTAYLQARGLRADGVDVPVPKPGDDLVQSQDPQAIGAYRGLWREAAQAYGCRCRSFNGRRLPYQAGSFDAVLFYASYEHIPLEQVGQATREAVRVLKNGGRAYVYRCPSAWAWKEHLARWTGAGAHAKLYGRAELRRSLEAAGLQVLTMERSDFFPAFVGPLQGAWNALTPALMLLDRWLRHSPLAVIYHHFEVRAVKPAGKR